MQRKCCNIILLLISVNLFSQASDKVLASKVFSIKVTENNSDGRVEPMQVDRVLFKEGKISTSFSKKNGFPPADFTYNVDSTSKPYIISFTAETVNLEKHKLKWSGTIMGDKIIGKAERDRNGKSSCTYQFEGVKK